MRTTTDASPGVVTAVPTKSSRKTVVGIMSVFVVLGAILTLAERWLANVLGDDLIATILLLIATIVGIALLSPVLSKTGRR